MRTFLGLFKRLVRRILRNGDYYRVPFGPLRGVRLQFRDQVNLREILGLWEQNNFQALTSLCNAGLLKRDADIAMFDIGANFGLYTMFFSRLLCGRGRVFAFEPAALPREMLVGNIRKNELKNVTVEPLACAGAAGEVVLYLASNHHTSSLRPERALTGAIDLQTSRVQSITLDSYWRQMKRPEEKTVLVKIDIEGAADMALPGCTDLAENERCFFLVESHSPAEDQALGDFSRGCGYQLYRTTNNRWVQNSDSVYPDPDGIWGTLLLIPGEKAREVRKVLFDR